MMKPACCLFLCRPALVDRPRAKPASQPASQVNSRGYTWLVLATLQGELVARRRRRRRRQFSMSISLVETSRPVIGRVSQRQTAAVGPSWLARLTSGGRWTSSASRVERAEEKRPALTAEGTLFRLGSAASCKYELRFSGRWADFLILGQVILASG